MIIWAFNLLLLSVFIFIIGMIKPHWLLFWMEKPNRFVIAGVSVILLMAGAILFGEGNVQNEPLSEVVNAGKPTVVIPVASESPSDLVKE
ncbi:MAG: hypothetical protein methR_P0128 [Methyloprofundus sp.]|nr:MAG: hypothetical protein methR_P0128 [Methyloprofundus sp.]